MTLHGLCAPNTLVVDFAYDTNHPLRLGNYPVSKHSLVASELDFYDDPHYESYSADEINRRAVALFDFEPENDNEVRLRAGNEIWVSYRHGQGWLVAEDPTTGENGLVPEEYVEICAPPAPADEPQRFLPHLLGGTDNGPAHVALDADRVPAATSLSGDDEWEDTDDEGDAGAARFDPPAQELARLGVS